MKNKNTPQPRNYLVKLALFRKAGVHRKSNKAVRRLEKSKKSGYSKVYFGIFCYNHLTMCISNDIISTYDRKIKHYSFMG